MGRKDKIIASAILILVGLSYRLIPHPPNFAPVAAISLFSGFYFRRYYILLPIAIMLLSDIYIGFYDWKLMAVVYSSFAAISLIGIILRKHKAVISILGLALSGSILFFLTTNFAVWIFASWYPHSLSGLLECYAMAIPFFKNTLAGDLFYTSLIFGAHEILAYPKARLKFIFNREDNYEKIS